MTVRGADACRSPGPATLICEAVETYARISVGQTDVIARIFDEPVYGRSHEDALEAMSDLLADAETMRRTLRRHSIAGSGQPYPEDAEAAFDIMQVIRHRLCHDSLEPGEETPSGVSFHKPMRRGPHDLPTIEKTQ